MKNTFSYLCFSLLVFLGSCKSTTSADLVALEDLDCVCGEMIGDVRGCHFAPCISGQGNPDNAFCACAGLADLGELRTAVAMGGGENRALGEMQHLALKSGRTIRGVLMTADGTNIELRLASGTTRKLTYTELAPRSIYRLYKASTDRDDGPGQVELGDFARDNGIYAHARRHYKYAVQADAGLEAGVTEEMAKLRELASNEILAEAKKAHEKGKVLEAEKLCTEVLHEFPDEPAADDAARMLGELAARADRERSSSIPDQTAEIADELKGARKRYDDAVKKNRDGLLASKRPTQAIKNFESASKSAERGRKDVAKLKKKHQGEPQFQRAADALDGLLVDEIVRTNVNLASVYMTRTSYNDALGAVNTALAHDPKNSEARALRARIEVAASDDDWGYGSWRVGRARAGRVGRIR